MRMCQTLIISFAVSRLESRDSSRITAKLTSTRHESKRYKNPFMVLACKYECSHQTPQLAAGNQVVSVRTGQNARSTLQTVVMAMLTRC